MPRLSTVCSAIAVVAIAVAFVAPQAASANTAPAPALGQLMFGTGSVSHPGVIIGRPRVYVVFWGTQWGTSSVDARGDLTFANDPDSGAPYLQEFFRGIGTGNERWSRVLTQYCAAPDVTFNAVSCPRGAARLAYPAGGTLAGAWYDATAPQPARAPWSDFQAEAAAAARHFGNVTPAANATAIYVLLSASGTDPEGYLGSNTCAGHRGDDDGSLGVVAAIDLPYLMDAGTSCGAGFVNPGDALDAYSIGASHEYAESVTDTEGGRGWYHDVADSNAGAEIADDCSWIQPGTRGGNGDIRTAHGTFAVTSLWSNDEQSCVMAPGLVGHTVPNGKRRTPAPRIQKARLTVDMLKSGIRSDGMLVRRK